ncbi:MAG: hypothetical protein HY962_00175 [Ignavibacteriae bacterium]|nr:hypothetical protein [Ignavibacteriota bacterium]
MAAFSASREFPRSAVVFTAAFLYIASITLLRPTPWMNIGTGFDFTMGLIWAGVALLAGFLSRRPSVLVPCFLIACLGPHHRVAILSAFVSGVVMLISTLYAERHDIRSFVHRAFVEKGAGYVLAIGLYMCVVWLLRLGDSTDRWSFLALAASMFAVPLAVYSLSYLTWTGDEYTLTIRNCGLVLLALGSVVLLYPAAVGAFDQYGVPLYMLSKAAASSLHIPILMEWTDPDYNSASLRGAHYAAMILFIAAAGWSVYAVRARAWMHAGAAALLAYAAAMGENAHALPGLALAGCLMGLDGLRGTRAGRMRAAALALLPFIAAVVLVLIVYNWDAYLRSLPKRALYTNALRQAVNDPVRLLLGEGPAAYASHAAAKRLSLPYREDNEFPVMPPFTSPRYDEALRQSFGENRYTTLHRPISGLLGFAMEWGVLGSALLLGAVYVLFRRVQEQTDGPARSAVVAAAITSLSLVGVSLAFRPYAEYPDIMAVASISFLLAAVHTVERTPAVATGSGTPAAAKGNIGVNPLSPSTFS